MLHRESRLVRPVWRWWLGALGAVSMIAGTSVAASAPAKNRVTALSPSEALAGFQLDPGLRIELVAAEPLVVAPVAFAFDERGRLYVVEGRGYPDPIKGKAAAKEGRIVLLEDTDGDGRFDRRTEFATGLSYPNGIAVWRGGVFVTCAPEILYLKDNDGDGVADERRVVLTGFDTSKTTQLRMSSPTLGADGKIYIASGLVGGKVTSPAHPERPAVNFPPADGRFDPDTLVYETTGGRGQFGLTFDGFGRRFVSSNRHPVQQIVLEPWHLRRNPQLAFAETMQAVSKVEAEARVWPISGASVSADFIPGLMAAPHAGTFTSACGLLVFGGTALPESYAGNVFICEPAQNLVQRQVLRGEGASFRSAPVAGAREFLASADPWFRPVFLGHGPDGALYVADMHRREIDHPVYLPAEARGGLDFEGGKDRGRLYRLTGDGETRRGPGVAFAFDRTPEGLVRELASPDAWRRETAHRLLLEQREVAADLVVPALEKCAAASPRPEARARSRWLLHANGALSETTVAAGLRDENPAVREQTLTLVLAAELLAKFPGLLPAALALVADADAHVRFACTLVLAANRDARAVDALAAIAGRDGENRWARAAVLSGVAGRLEAFFAALHAQPKTNTRAVAAVLQDLGRLFGVGAPPEACRGFLAEMLRPDADFASSLPAVLGLADGWRTRPEAKAAERDAFAALLGGDGESSAREAMAGFIARTSSLAADASAPLAMRLRAVSLLGAVDTPRRAAVFGDLLDARQPPGLQLEVVRALERIGDAPSGALLLAGKNWTRYSPQVRAGVLVALTAKPPLLTALFDAIERGAVAATEIPPAKRTQLMRYADAALRERAGVIFGRLDAGDRMQVYRAHRDVLALPADVARGREVFLRVCSACHTRGGVGGKVGPDLTGLRRQPAEAILLHVLVPNYEVAPAYQAVTLETRDGRTLTGWIAAETENGLTLRTAFGTEEPVLRANIATLTASGASLMPDGLEQAMSRAELAGLIAFLKSED